MVTGDGWSVLEIFAPANYRRKTSLLSHRESEQKGQKSADVQDHVRWVRDDAVSLGQECVRLAKHGAVPLDQLPIGAEQIWFPPGPNLTDQKKSVSSNQIHPGSRGIGMAQRPKRKEECHGNWNRVDSPSPTLSV